MNGVSSRMLNRAAIDWQGSSDRDGSWETDSHPGLRLWVLFAGMLLPLFAIGGRLVWVQTSLTDSYAREFERTVERTEPIPCPDGRILAANGEVLAEDVLQIGLSAHYRWLEEPPNPAWLKQQALSRLDRAERRDRLRVAAEMEHVVQQRQQMWADLTRLTGMDAHRMEDLRRDVQIRVERIRDRADERRWQRLLEHRQSVAPDEPGPWWRNVWSSVVAAVTTPPRREADEPLVVEEELAYHSLLPEIDPVVATQIESRPSQFPGLRVAESTRRVYPHSRAAPHVVGVRRPIDAETLARLEAVHSGGDGLEIKVGDRVGQSGLERHYDSILRGRRGLRTLTFNRQGEILRNEIARDRRPGRDIVLSLNLGFQEAAEELLDEVVGKAAEDPVTGEPLPVPPGGSLIALDVRTGAILASATAPRFDLNVLVEPDATAWQEIQADPGKPLFDRSTRMTIPPGSVFKTISAVSYLESGKVDPEQPFDCQGYLERPDQFRCYVFRRFQVGHGELGLVDAIARSCNVYFFAQARHVGPEPIHLWASRFGIGQKTGVDLPGEQAGHLPPPRPARDGRRMGETLLLSIGQADLTVTPMQIARMMAAVANGGALVTPHFAETAGTPVVSSDGSSEIRPPDPVRIPDLESRTLQWVRMGLQQVVADSHGTAYKTVRLDQVAIAGKTGTAEAGGRRPDHAWFAGYVPAGRPRIAFVVVLEHAGSGGHAAGPVARKFVQAMLHQGLLAAQPATAQK